MCQRCRKPDAFDNHNDRFGDDDNSGQRLGKNPYACRDKARYHGFVNANVCGGAADDDGDADGEEVGISSSYVNWSSEEDACLLAYASPMI